MKLCFIHRYRDVSVLYTLKFIYQVKGLYAYCLSISYSPKLHPFPVGTMSCKLPSPRCDDVFLPQNAFERIPVVSLFMLSNIRERAELVFVTETQFICDRVTAMIVMTPEEKDPLSFQANF